MADTTTVDAPSPHDAEAMRHELAALRRLIAQSAVMPDEETPMGRLTREFFSNTYGQARDGLLAKTDKIVVTPEPTPWPREFRYEMHVENYKRKPGPDAAVELADGPLTGTVYYRPDLFTADPPTIAVAVDDTAFFHPNFSRAHGLLCLGDVPRTFALAEVLEHVYRIVSYQNTRVFDPADIEAAEYFARDPQAMEGLAPAQPLY